VIPDVEVEAGISVTEHPRIADLVEAAARKAAGNFDPLVLTLTLLMYRCISAFDEGHKVELKPLGLNRSAFNVLTVLHRHDGPMNLAALAEAVSAKPPNLTSVVRDLHERGLIRRWENPADRRSQCVEISDDANSFLCSFLSLHWDFLASLFSSLTTCDKDQLARLLTKVLAGVEADPDGHSSSLAPAVVASARRSTTLSREFTMKRRVKMKARVDRPG